MTPQPVTLTVTVLIDGQHAADVADDLLIDVDAGALDQAILNTLRAHLVNQHDARDWRIVRATVTPQEDAAHLVTASQPDAGAGIEEDATQPDDDDDPPTCPACGSTDAAPLGTLGALLWRRCKACGIDYSQPAHDARTAAQEGI